MSCLTIFNRRRNPNHVLNDRREELEELLARQAETDESGALKLSTGLFKDVVEIGNGVINGAQGIKNLFQ